ncbi:MAG: hypothetical protein ACHQSE_01690 [Gemmatimonadales bacterium]
MLTFFLAAQLAVATLPDTATYSSPALRTLVSEAVLVNNRVPPALGRYHATLESEISLGARDGGGHEDEESIEQVASALRWDRDGEFEQHVIGYRSQMIGLQFATIGFFRNAWVVPSLYGNRLSLLYGVDTTQRRGVLSRARSQRPGSNATSRTTLVAVHPLSVERDRLYRFSGGDTVEHLNVGDRDIRIVRVLVEPKRVLPYRTVVFSGEVDLDADRKHVVRMRGSFASTPDGPGGALTGFVSTIRPAFIVFVELVNSEVDQQFWLPSYQRFEAQAMLPVIGDAKAVVRIVSHFSDYIITPPDSAALAAGRPLDTLAARPHPLTIAPHDSLASFRGWHDEIGAATAHASSDDFMDVAPARWRADGRPEVLLQTQRLSDLVRFNRIEGLFTGLGVAAHMRDAAPGLTLRAVGGYAWNEHTARARMSAELARGAWSYGLHAGRSLDITNDFRDPLDSGSTLGALFGTDDYDYVDRYSAGASVSRALAGRNLIARFEAGWADDRPIVNTLDQGPFHAGYRPNRGVDPGTYMRTALTLAWHSDANAEYLRPGFGATLGYLRGDGRLSFQRVDLVLTTRRNAGRWTLASRLDAGVVLGSPLPQQLFELGSTEGLPGYGYKQFAGNQAVVLRTLAMYRLNILTAPLHITQFYWIPPISPALAVSAQSGWTGASGAAADAAVLRLGGSQQQPVSTVTGNARATVAAGIRFFGGAIGASMARAVDRPDRWRAQLDFGTSF